MLPDKNRYFFFFPLLKEPGKELWGGEGRAAHSRSDVQLVTGIRSPAATRRRNGPTGKRSPKIILLEFHLQGGCPWGKPAGAAYKKGLESAVRGKTGDPGVAVECYADPGMDIVKAVFHM